MFCARLDPSVDDEDGGKELIVKEVRRPLMEGWEGGGAGTGAERGA
jgi:hypothetical protein